jgi:hypothetical protein
VSQARAVAGIAPAPPGFEGQRKKIIEVAGQSRLQRRKKRLQNDRKPL